MKNLIEVQRKRSQAPVQRFPLSQNFQGKNIRCRYENEIITWKLQLVTKKNFKVTSNISNPERQRKSKIRKTTNSGASMSMCSEESFCYSLRREYPPPSLSLFPSFSSSVSFFSHLLAHSLFPSLPSCLPHRKGHLSRVFGSS